MTLLTDAVKYHGFGANVLPIEKGKKKPVGEWQQWIGTPQTLTSMQAQPWGDADRLGIVNGINGFRNFDIDKNADPFIVSAILKQLGLPDDYQWVETSQSGSGFHIWFRCNADQVPGFPNLPEDQPGVIAGEIPSGGQLELRWRRNQTIVAASQDPTKWCNGTPEGPPALVEGKAVAGAFLAVAAPKERKERPADFVGKGEGDRPGDDFNVRGDIRPFLEKAGWTFVDRTGEVEYWRRPGKDNGSASATLNYFPGLFYVFSSNAEPFEQNVGYSLFAVYAILEHGGNWKKAGVQLQALGYGKYPKLEKFSDEELKALRGAGLQYRYSDLGNAEVFALINRDSYRFDKKRRDGWMVWNGTAWREAERGSVEQAMLDTIRCRGHAAFTISDDAQREDAAKWALRSESGKHYMEALNRAKTMPGIVSVTTDFDTDPWLITLRNATFDLRTGEIRDPSKSDLITKVANVTYDPEANAPVWESFISDIFEGDTDVIRYVQKALGMCLSGDISEQAFFICYGQGANGKSTLLNTVRRVLGDYGATTSFATFDADSRNEYGNDLAALKGRRLVIAIESEQNKKLAEARVKAITGGEELSCRFLYGEFFEYRPTYKVWLATNHKPTVRGADHGIWRRLHFIPFNVRFGPDGVKPIDRQLDDKLRAETAGIFNWLYEGFLAWRAEGLEVPAKIQEATEEYQQENDSVARFVAECCEISEHAHMEAGEAYPVFRKWMEDQGESARYIPNMTLWGRRMSEKGFQKVKNGKGRMEYRGIGLQEITFGLGHQ